jgi:maltose/moltooligosaccharide transporter
VTASPPAAPATGTEASPGAEARADARKPYLPFAKILQMNVGFFGLQFSFGLQQSNMGPIYGYLGADEATMPLLWLAGPITGLLVQPLVGAMSDRTGSRWGRRTPYFLIGAVLCSLSLLAMPYSPTLWVAASILWILDAANNVTMEPYRAYVSDRLASRQQPNGFLVQAAFTGLAQTLAYLAPTLAVWAGLSRDSLAANGIPIFTYIAFIVGAFLSIATILFSILRVPELPLTAEEQAFIRRGKLTGRGALKDIGDAMLEMPRPMRQMAVMKFFQWYAMFAYWQFIAFAVARSLFGTSDAASAGFREGVLVTGQIGAFYNFIAFISGFALMPVARRFGPRNVHALCLIASGLGMLAVPLIGSEQWLFLAMVGIGLGWASMMGNPYAMLARSIPAERTGIYMGIFNMFIVIPMLIQTLTMPLYYDAWLGGDARNAITMAGAMMLCAAVATLMVRLPERDEPA